MLLPLPLQWLDLHVYQLRSDAFIAVTNVFAAIAGLHVSKQTACRLLKVGNQGCWQVVKQRVRQVSGQAGGVGVGAGTSAN
mmetsp:Transcript_125805/g.245354  ORF Transcript_125805/g.245354 Transcript_125805/m.245354 type:complete len:81 (+) Transcript_125805:387-629(+)